MGHRWTERTGPAHRRAASASPGSPNLGLAEGLDVLGGRQVVLRGGRGGGGHGPVVHPCYVGCGTARWVGVLRDAGTCGGARAVGDCACSSHFAILRTGQCGDGRDHVRPLGVRGQPRRDGGRDGVRFDVRAQRRRRRGGHRSGGQPTVIRLPGRVGPALGRRSGPRRRGGRGIWMPRRGDGRGGVDLGAGEWRLAFGGVGRPLVLDPRPVCLGLVANVVSRH
mmetsp:Transcript_35912/g.64208  ORF Transcript_35912/g.64208 Transcript_35912/m.64208 type:complete len:223 (+) Transcript_35912:3319-3987(+)